METVRRLSSARWLIPLLAVIGADGGSRFGILARRLPISRSVLARHLALLEQFGWIRRNPGHGHPLRPEYLLTEAGPPVAGWCERAMAARERMGLEPDAFGRWTLPLLFELAPERRRFTLLQQRLAPVTPRALSLTLNQALSERLVERQSPAQLYGLAERGRDFAAPLLV